MSNSGHLPTTASSKPLNLMASYVYQRKSLKFTKTARIKVMCDRTPIVILETALANTPRGFAGSEIVNSTADATGRNSFTAALTAASWNAGAVTELASMWNVLARCQQCLVNNGLATNP